MFTLDQIKSAHTKVKSGADFPSYIRAIKELGVTGYEMYVSDGHVIYRGAGDYIAKTPAKYEPLTIALPPDAERFTEELNAHQQGKTDFTTFIKMCSETGIEKWEISMEKKTCTYFDRAGNEILMEKIP